MYNAKYVSSNGNTVYLGIEHKCAFDIKGIGGVPVNLGKSQNFSDIGESVTSQTVSGTTLNINGVIFGDNIYLKKDELRRAFSPLTSGTLYVNDKYFIDVFVKQTPTISPTGNNGKFSVLLFAPFPFFKRTSPTRFTMYLQDKYIATNSGDVIVPLKITINASTDNGDPDDTITNVYITGTQDKIFKFQREIYLFAGEKIEISRSSDGSIKAEHISRNGLRTDFSSFIDVESNLFDMKIGQEALELHYEYNGNATDELTASLSAEFNEAYALIYEIDSNDNNDEKE